MKFQSLLVSACAFSVATAKTASSSSAMETSHEGEHRRLQLPDLDGSSITNLIEEFGEDILDTIDDSIGDWPIFQDDFSPFNSLSDLLVPIVNEIIQDVILSEFDPYDLGIDGEIDIGDVALPLDVCTATAVLTYKADDLVGLSQFEIMELQVKNRKINLSLDESSFRFDLVFKAGFPDGAIKSGINTQIFFRVCGTSVTLASGGDLILNGPTIETIIRFRGKISLTGQNIELKDAIVREVEVDQESADVLLDQEAYDAEEARNLEAAMSNQLDEDVLDAANDEFASTLQVKLEERLNRVLPLEFGM